jgi:hypothetical protein
MRLYRPIGYQELELIANDEFSAFPPRLPSQPIFYPVLNLEYGMQIAKDWNTMDSIIAIYYYQLSIINYQLSIINYQLSIN